MSAEQPKETDRFAAHLERHAALCERWGKPEPVSLARAFVTAGISAPDDAVAFRYSSREAAEAFAASNMEHYGYRSLGIAETEDGVIGVTSTPVRYVRGITDRWRAMTSGNGLGGQLPPVPQQ